MKHSILYFLTHPKYTIHAIRIKLSARYDIEQRWKSTMDYPLNLDNPKTFCEKLNWLKLYDHNPLYTTLVDKYAVKKYVAKTIGEKYVVPVYGVYKSVEEIDLSKLPNQFVLKCTHDSGSVVICRDKQDFDLLSAKHKLAKALKVNFYKYSREWPYKNVPRRIIAEKYLCPSTDILDNPLEADYSEKITNYIIDYKFFCFGGEAKVMYIGHDYGDSPTSDFFDMDFNHLPIQGRDKNAEVPPGKPSFFEEMRCMAEKLSKNIPQVRVDFYYAENQIYFGEMTFFHCGGFQSWTPPEWNTIFGQWIKLPPVKQRSVL